MKDAKLVWSDEAGDLRKKNKKSLDEDVDEGSLLLHLRRLTSGKGRVVIEISSLPNSKTWCKKIAKELKKSLGVGGAFKKDYIEIHGDHLQSVIKFFESRSIRCKQTGG